MRFTFILVVLLWFFVKSSVLHPQCLDFHPPFEPYKELEFCKTYKAYGCCSYSKDQRLKDNFRYIEYSLKIRNQTDEICLDFLKDLICLECHPYAAHVFDAEHRPTGNEMFSKWSVNFPGLCRNYCLESFERCRSTILQFASRPAFNKFVQNANLSAFCSWAEIPDVNYCYPDVNNVETSTKKIRTEHKNKYCVKPFSDSSFSNALVAVHANDRSNRLFVGEQRGLVYVILQNGTTLKKPFLNITDRIINSGSPWDERGFLGLAFHPNYKENGRFYVYYSASRNDVDRNNYTISQWYWHVKHQIRISEFTVDPKNPNTADHTSELPLLEIDQPEPNHNGGMLLFGKDGYLHIFVGDGGGRGDDHGIYGNGLLLSTLLGKVLRIDVDVEDKLYGIPDDNPFRDNSDVKPEIYAYGIRNIWRCSLDNTTERIFCGDVGQNKFEEIDIILKGRNYGWRAYEGFSCFDQELCDQKLQNLEFPIMVYGHDVGRSVVGGYVYRGCDNPNMYGTYFFADTMNGKIFAAKENLMNNTWSYDEIEIGNSSFCNNGLTSYLHKHILTFGESESGEIYILSTSYPSPRYQGSSIYRLVDPVQRGHPTMCQFKVIEAKPLKKIKRRNIYKKYLKEKKEKMKIEEEKKEEKKHQCVDTRSFCKRLFKIVSKKRKKPVLNCYKARHISSKYCRKTCGLCSKKKI